MSRIVTSVSVLKSLKDEALTAANKGQFPGASNFSAVVEIALDKLLHPEDTPLETVEPEVPA